MPRTIHVLAEAEAELMSMPIDIRARFLHVSELLQTYGSQEVGMPHIRHLEGKLWEMRMKGRDGIARAVSVIDIASADELNELARTRTFGQRGGVANWLGKRNDSLTLQIATNLKMVGPWPRRSRPRRRSSFRSR